MLPHNLDLNLLKKTYFKEDDDSLTLHFLLDGSNETLCRFNIVDPHDNVPMGRKYKQCIRCMRKVINRIPFIHEILLNRT